MSGVKVISVRRAHDDSGWHIRFSVDDLGPQAAWIATEGYLDYDRLDYMLADRLGYKQDNSADDLHFDIKPSNIHVNDLIAIHYDRIAGKVNAPDIKPPSPPRLAEFLFSWLAPAKSFHAQLGDMQEIFETNVARFGKSRARMLYWAQVLRAVGPGIWRRIKKLGFIGILIDYGRSKIGL